MSLLDYKQLRPDVAAYMKKAGKMQTMQGLKYLIFHPNFKTSFLKLKQQLEEDNDRLLKSGAIDMKNARIHFPDYKTRLYHARVTRAAVEGTMRKALKGYVEGQHVRIERVRAGDVPAEWTFPRDDRGSRAILHIHGGGFNLCSAATHRGMNARLSSLSKTKILSIDYRLAPEHKHPAALDDCLHAFQWLIDQGYPPEKIILLGDSAGGNLVLATLHCLKQQKRNLPSAAMCISPFADWTFPGKSWFDNAPTDPIVCDLPVAYYGRCYLELSGVELDDPLISPVYGDYRGFPPLLLIVSKSEMCYDDSQRIAEKAMRAKVEVKLEEWDDMIHVFPLFGLAAGWAEADEALAKMTAFINEKLRG